MLDVREESERAEGVVPGAILVPYRLVGTAPPTELDPARPVFTICASGARAMLAASLLARAGLRRAAGRRRRCARRSCRSATGSCESR